MWDAMVNDRAIAVSAKKLRFFWHPSFGPSLKRKLKLSVELVFAVTLFDLALVQSVLSLVQLYFSPISNAALSRDNLCRALTAARPQQWRNASQP
jgi:hypothetical protein